MSRNPFSFGKGSFITLVFGEMNERRGETVGTDYFIADLHFGGEEIVRYENRPFGNVKEMENYMIKQWNSIVTKEDTVYVLGDFSTNQSAEEDSRILKELSGRKILVMGNHDQHRSQKDWRTIGFEECSMWPILYQDFFLLSHEPLYLNSNMPYANFYGHVHGNDTYRTIASQSACVCVERWEYTPVSFEALVTKMKSVK